MIDENHAGTSSQGKVACWLDSALGTLGKFMRVPLRARNPDLRTVFSRSNLVMYERRKTNGSADSARKR